VSVPLRSVRAPTFRRNRSRASGGGPSPAVILSGLYPLSAPRAERSETRAQFFLAQMELRGCRSIAGCCAQSSGLCGLCALPFSGRTYPLNRSRASGGVPGPAVCFLRWFFLSQAPAAARSAVGSRGAGGRPRARIGRTDFLCEFFFLNAARQRGTIVSKESSTSRFRWWSKGKR